MQNKNPEKGVFTNDVIIDPLSFHGKTFDFINRYVLSILDGINRFIIVSLVVRVCMNDDGLVAVVPEQVARVHDGDEGIADVLTEEDNQVPGLSDQLVEHGPRQLFD